MASTVAVVRQLKTKGLTATEKVHLAQRALVDDAVFVPRKAKFLLDWAISEILRTASPKYISSGDSRAPHINASYWEFIYHLIAGNKNWGLRSTNHELSINDIHEVLHSKSVLLPAIATAVEAAVRNHGNADLGKTPIRGAQESENSDGTDESDNTVTLLKWLRICYEVLYGKGTTTSDIDDGDDGMGQDDIVACAPTPAVDVQMAYVSRISTVLHRVLPNQHSDDLNLTAAFVATYTDLYQLVYVGWASLGATQERQGNQKKIYSSTITKLLAPAAALLSLPTLTAGVSLGMDSSGSPAQDSKSKTAESSVQERQTHAHKGEDTSVSAYSVEVQVYVNNIRGVVLATLVRLLMHKDHIAHYISLLGGGSLAALMRGAIVETGTKGSRSGNHGDVPLATTSGKKRKRNAAGEGAVAPADEDAPGSSVDTNTASGTYSAVYTKQLFDFLAQCAVKRVCASESREVPPKDSAKKSRKGKNTDTNPGAKAKASQAAEREYADCAGAIEMIPSLYARFCGAMLDTKSKGGRVKFSNVYDEGSQPTDHIRRTNWRMFQALVGVLALPAHAPKPLATETRTLQDAQAQTQTQTKQTTSARVFGDRLGIVRQLLHTLNGVKAFNPAEDISTSSRPPAPTFATGDEDAGTDLEVSDTVPPTLSAEITEWLTTAAGMLLDVVERFPSGAVCADASFSAGLFGVLRDAYTITPTSIKPHMGRVWRLSWVLLGRESHSNGTLHGVYAWEGPCALLTGQILRTEFRMRLVEPLFETFLRAPESLTTLGVGTTNHKAPGKKKRKVLSSTDKSTAVAGNAATIVSPSLSGALSRALAESVGDLPPGMAGSVITSVTETIAPVLATTLKTLTSGYMGSASESAAETPLSTLLYQLKVLGVIVSNIIIVDHNQTHVLIPVLQTVHSTIVQPVVNTWQTSVGGPNEMSQALVDLLGAAYTVCYHSNEALFLCSCVSSERYTAFRHGLQLAMVDLARALLTGTVGSAVEPTQPNGKPSKKSKKKHNNNDNNTNTSTDQRIATSALRLTVVAFLVQNVRFAESLAISLASDGRGTRDGTSSGGNGQTRGNGNGNEKGYENKNGDVEAAVGVSAKGLTVHCVETTALVVDYIMSQFAGTLGEVRMTGTENRDITAHALALWSLMRKKVAMLAKYWTQASLKLYAEYMVRTLPDLTAHERTKNSTDNVLFITQARWGVVSKAAMADAAVMEIPGLVTEIVRCIVAQLQGIYTEIGEKNKNSEALFGAIGLLRSASAAEAKDPVKDEGGVDWKAVQKQKTSPLSAEQLSAVFALLTGLEACPIRHMNAELLQLCLAAAVSVDVCLPPAVASSVDIRLLCRKLLYKGVTAPSYRGGKERLPGFAVLLGDGLWHITSMCMDEAASESAPKPNHDTTLRHFTREIFVGCLRKMLTSASEQSTSTLTLLDARITQMIDNSVDHRASGGSYGSGFDMDIATTYLQAVGGYLESAASHKQARQTSANASAHGLPVDKKNNKGTDKSKKKDKDREANSRSYGGSFHSLYQKMLQHALSVVDVAGAQSEGRARAQDKRYPLFAHGARQLGVVSAILNTPVPTTVPERTGSATKPKKTDRVQPAPGAGREDSGRTSAANAQARMAILVACLKQVSGFLVGIRQRDTDRVHPLSTVNQESIVASETDTDAGTEILSAVLGCMVFLTTSARILGEDTWAQAQYSATVDAMWKRVLTLALFVCAWATEAQHATQRATPAPRPTHTHAQSQPQAPSPSQKYTYTHTHEARRRRRARYAQRTVNACIELVCTLAVSLSASSDMFESLVQSLGEEIDRGSVQSHLSVRGSGPRRGCHGNDERDQTASELQSVCRTHAAVVCLSALHAHAIKLKQHGAQASLRRAAPKMVAVLLNVMNRVSLDMDTLDIEAGRSILSSRSAGETIASAFGGLFGPASSLAICQSKAMNVSAWTSLANTNSSEALNYPVVTGIPTDMLLAPVNVSVSTTQAPSENTVHALVSLSVVCVGGLSLISGQEDLILKPDQVAAVLSCLALAPPVHALGYTNVGNSVGDEDAEEMFGTRQSENDSDDVAAVAMRAMLEVTQPSGIGTVGGRLIMVTYGLLQSLLRRNANSIAPCIHLYINALRTLLWHMAYVGMTEDIKTSTLCADSIARLYEELSKHKVTVSKYVPHIIGDYIGVAQFVALPESVTEAISSGIYSLIGTLSPHDTSFLFARLDATGREIYRNLSAEYKTRHKYSGKF